jgi:hypothetical protein
VRSRRRERRNPTKRQRKIGRRDWHLRRKGAKLKARGRAKIYFDICFNLLCFIQNIHTIDTQYIITATLSSSRTKRSLEILWLLLGGSCDVSAKIYPASSLGLSPDKSAQNSLDLRRHQCSQGH